MQLLYCILVSDIIFNIFSLCSVLFTFLRISTETRPRITFFIQVALNQAVLLAGSLFVADFTFKQCSEAGQSTFTNSADLTEGGQDRGLHFSLDIRSPTWKSMEGEKAQPLAFPGGSGNTYWISEGPSWTHKKNLINSGSKVKSKDQGPAPVLSVTALCNLC